MLPRRTTAIVVALTVALLSGAVATGSVATGSVEPIAIASRPANGTETVRTFRYQGDAIVEERVNGVLDRQYLVDEAGSIVAMILASGPSAGTYLITYDAHGDALAVWRIKPADGHLEIANSIVYTTWGAPQLTTAHTNSANGGAAYGDLGFRFLYVGEFDVRWDNELGLGLAYMHARHYSPALGRFLQPDPDRSEANLYAYAANNPVTEIDPDGTCFIVCAVVNAVADTAIYLATTDSSEWSAGGIAGAAATGAVTGFLGVGLLSKVTKVGALASKVLTKVPKATRAAVNKAKAAIRRPATSCVRRNSFDAATPVTLADGTAVPIGELAIGDLVLAWDETTATLGSYPITHLWVHDDPVTGVVVIAGEAIATTPGHPFFTIERGWIEAADLRVGDHVPSASGRARPGLERELDPRSGHDDRSDGRGRLHVPCRRRCVAGPQLWGDSATGNSWH